VFVMRMGLGGRGWGILWFCLGVLRYGQIGCGNSGSLGCWDCLGDVDVE